MFLLRIVFGYQKNSESQRRSPHEQLPAEPVHHQRRDAARHHLRKVKELNWPPTYS